MDLREVPSGGLFRRHPWEETRYRFLADLLTDFGNLATAESILDVGSGDGWFASQLVREVDPSCAITCWDIEYGEPSTLDRTVIADHDRIRTVAERPSERFEMMLLLDVLEHVEDDVGFLSELVENNLAEEATVLVSVPAWQSLSAAHDVALAHHRRYSPAHLFEILDRVGLRPLRKGGLFHSLLVPRAMTVARNRVLGTRSVDLNGDSLRWKHGKLFTSLVTAALRADNFVSRVASSSHIQLPGLSVWALCHK